ncbi:dephospho-CoA kinase [Polaribacter sp.]|nr:dephospho-CoA kinase [Polaribacter sp.]MDC1515791.1 dephospho-CoA kinase [Polaribacter sp.]
MIVGLTGGIGSGKTTVLNFFKEFENVAVYIADVEAKKLMNSSPIIREKLINAFGKQTFIDQDLNRVFLAKIVFNDKQKLQVLNAIVHPEVAIHFKNFVNKNKNKAYVLYENAILFETKNDRFCDCVITVYASPEERISRIIKRDATTREAVLDRMKNQFSDEKKMLQSHYVIDNNSLNNMKEEIHRIHNFLT